MFTTHIYLIYMYKLDLALNNLQRLICHKTQPNQTNSGYNGDSYKILIRIYHFFLNRRFGIMIDCCYNGTQRVHGLSTNIKASDKWVTWFRTAVNCLARFSWILLSKIGKCKHVHSSRILLTKLLCIKPKEKKKRRKFHKLMYNHIKWDCQ